MRITEEQKSILDSLIVERLNKRPENRALTSSFKNRKNPNLERVITTEHAFNKDNYGSVAYYVVKSKDGTFLLYFSLKCGELFKQLDIKKMTIAKEVLNHWRIINNQDKHNPLEIQSSIQYLIDHSQEIQEILPNIQSYASKKGYYTKDVEKELNKEISRVLETYPAIEIVEFCANDNAQQKWKEFGLPKKMGECVFWHHIVPILLSVQNIVGCEYVYLFAADGTKDRILANYYQNVLHFEFSDTIGTNKPHYDFMCYFLCQIINTLSEKRESFYNNFNPDEKQEDII